MVTSQKTIENSDFSNLRNLLKRESSDSKQINSEILKVLKDNNNILKELSLKLDLQKIKENIGNGYKKIPKELNKEKQKDTVSKTFLEEFKDRLNDYKQVFIKDNSLNDEILKKDDNIETDKLEEEKKLETKTLEWQKNLLQEIKLLRKDILSFKPAKPTKPTTLSSTGFKETPSGILVPESIKIKGTTEPDIANIKKAMLGDGINVKILNYEDIKSEITGGGSSISDILPDILKPSNKPGIPSPTNKPSLGSRIGKFLMGTGGKILGAAAAVGLGAYTAYSGVNEAEDKKQIELQNIEQKIQSGEITAEEGKELKKEISAKTTEDKGGSIGKGTGLAAGAIGGGIAGAKVGATIGTFLGGPVGTILGAGIGTIAGGAIGAISGSSVGQNIGGAIGKGVAGVKSFFGMEDISKKTKEAVQETTSSEIQFSEMTFAKNDPENYKKFVEFRNKRTEEIAKDQAKKFNLKEPSKTDVVVAQELAKVEAIKKFQKEIEAAGAGKVTTTENKNEKQLESEGVPSVDKKSNISIPQDTSKQRTQAIEQYQTSKEEEITATSKIKEFEKANPFDYIEKPTPTQQFLEMPGTGKFNDPKKQAEYNELKKEQEKALDKKKEAIQKYREIEGTQKEKVLASGIVETNIEEPFKKLEALTKRFGYKEEQFLSTDGKTYDMNSINRVYEKEMQKELNVPVPTSRSEDMRGIRTGLESQPVPTTPILTSRSEDMRGIRTGLESKPVPTTSVPTSRSEGIEGIRTGLESQPVPTTSVPTSRSEGIEGIRTGLESQPVPTTPILTSRSEGIEGIRTGLESKPVPTTPVPTSRSEGIEGGKASLESKPVPTTSVPTSRSEGIEGGKASLESKPVPTTSVPTSRSEDMRGIRTGLESQPVPTTPILTSRSEGIEGGKASLESFFKTNVEKTDILNKMSVENEELKRKSAAPIMAPPIIANNIQSNNTQTLAQVKAQPRGSTSSSLEKYMERNLVY
jgi:hypothetical protein